MANMKTATPGLSRDAPPPQGSHGRRQGSTPLHPPGNCTQDTQAVVVAVLTSVCSLGDSTFPALRPGLDCGRRGGQ